MHGALSRRRASVSSNGAGSPLPARSGFPKAVLNGSISFFDLVHIVPLEKSNERYFQSWNPAAQTIHHRSPCSLAGPVEIMVFAQVIRMEEGVVTMCWRTHLESGFSPLMQRHAALRG